ncbi:sporulation protein rmd1 [Coemansia sp. RSA 922]|nr:sporulation protein rmd1 [Coemansia sp. RSA 922]
MSFVISDSEGEDTHPAPLPKFRPRVVNRPTPVRARRTSSSTNTSKGKEVAGGAAALHLSDSDDDEDSGSDDTSFFRMGRPSLGLTSAIDANDSDGSEREAPKAPSVRPPPQVTTDIRLESIDYSDSDSQDDDNVGNRLQQHYGSAEKRKHSDNSDQADHSRLRRSRSVSLTPPPEPHRASTTLGQKTRQDSTEPDVQVLDSDSDADIVATASTSLSQRLRMEESLDLDPALRAIVQSSSATRRQTAGPATTDIEAAKAHIEFHFIYDEEFLQYDLPRIWEHKRWGQTSLQWQRQCPHNPYSVLNTSRSSIPINRKSKQVRLASQETSHEGSYPPRMRREIVVPPSGMHRTGDSMGRSTQRPPKPAFRTTKTSQKLKILPEDEEGGPSTDVDDYLGLTGVYDQIEHMRGAQDLRNEITRLKNLPMGSLPRVTAYATASSYTMTLLFKWIQSRKDQNDTAPKLLDECIYSPFVYGPSEAITINMDEILIDDDRQNTEFSETYIPIKSEIFIFDYGVIVIWGMDERHEKEFLRELEPFEVEKIDEDDIEMEELEFYINPNAQSRIYNDVISLRTTKGHMAKLAISHAIAQATKLSLYEGLVDETIEATRHIPQRMAESGTVEMTRKGLIRKIGQLFIMRVNVNLVSNILDTPEIFWSEPTLQPLYAAIREYLEIPQRVEIMNHRVSVISDLLDMLNGHLNGMHGEFLEWIVIILIGVEIIIGVVTITVEAAKLSY